MSLRHRHWSLLVICCFPIVSFAGDNGDTSALKYRAESSEVRVTFFATDKNERPIREVTKEDFAIVDSDIVVRNFRSLVRRDQTQPEIVVLVDTSESVAASFESTKSQVLKIMSGMTAIPGDHLSVLTFGGNEPVLLCSRGCNDPVVTQKLRTLTPTGPTPLFDALSEAAKLLAARRLPEVHPVVFLFSDGHDTMSKLSMEDAIQEVVSSGAVIYSIQVDKESARETDTLRSMSQDTGGRYYNVNTMGEPLRDVLADLQAEYTVTYELPTRLVGFHSLRILPKHDLNVQFHCRKGYYYASSR